MSMENPLPSENRQVVNLEDMPQVCVERTREEGQSFAKVECDWEVIAVNGDKVRVFKQDAHDPEHGWFKSVSLDDLKKWNLHLEFKSKKEEGKAA